jgi:PhnB protein
MSKHKPDGWPTLTPRIFTSDVEGLVAFLRSVFGGEGEVRPDAPSEIRIGDSIVMVSDGGGVRDAMPAFLYVYVADTDATFGRAIAAGAEAIEGPSNMPYGDRRATVRDRWGNIWQIATHRAL